MLELLALLACRCDAGPSPLPEPEPHYAEFDHLVDLTAQGQLGPAKDLARDLVGPDDDAKLASAAGYLQTAATTEDLVDGVSAMAEACGACHAAKGVEPLVTPPPPSGDAYAARRAAWSLVWGARP